MIMASLFLILCAFWSSVDRIFSFSFLVYCVRCGCEPVSHLFNTFSLASMCATVINRSHIFCFFSSPAPILAIITKHFFWRYGLQPDSHLFFCSYWYNEKITQNKRNVLQLQQILLITHLTHRSL